MEDNETQPTNVLDLIATDSSPAEITDTLKSMIYAKAGERIDGMKKYAAASLFGQEPETIEEPTAEAESETGAGSTLALLRVFLFSLIAFLLSFKNTSRSTSTIFNFSAQLITVLKYVIRLTVSFGHSKLKLSIKLSTSSPVTS